MHDASVRLTIVVLVFMAIIGCTPSDIASTADVEQTQVATSTSEPAPTGTFTPGADATRTPRPTQTPTTVPSATPTLDPATLPAMRIGFVRSESEMWMDEADIWVINADGSDERLVVHEPYGEVRLTGYGTEYGEFLLRRHRIIGLILSHYGLSSEEACEEASRIECYISRSAINKMCRALGHPTTGLCGDICHDPLCER